MEIMYCPVCLNNTLKICSSGVIKLTFNGMARNTSLFTYNLKKDNPDKMKKYLRERFIDYLEWYSTFQNKEVIEKLEIYSADFKCDNGCAVGGGSSRMSVVGPIYEAQEVIDMFKEEAEKFKIPENVSVREF
jgi:hypothetical protein